MKYSLKSIFKNQAEIEEYISDYLWNISSGGVGWTDFFKDYFLKMCENIFVNEATLTKEELMIAAKQYVSSYDILIFKKEILDYIYDFEINDLSFLKDFGYTDILDLSISEIVNLHVEKLTIEMVEEILNNLETISNEK
ncbi:hypothetical protein [[Mycoplasma] anseris]|uniref:Uncharacterized protein n=1 Tax=[Mycoplasma] anseris TaxID=92400 RepID=A0A2Z4ND92_9BACT|nr:hypothetical protein [[Mycoplasma] anseris]AWX69552.1 hypothetical protein DP065_02190 [[Mycoplasma] anseris]